MAMPEITSMLHASSVRKMQDACRCTRLLARSCSGESCVTPECPGHSCKNLARKVSLSLSCSNLSKETNSSLQYSTSNSWHELGRATQTRVNISESCLRRMVADVRLAWHLRAQAQYGNFTGMQAQAAKLS